MKKLIIIFLLFALPCFAIDKGEFDQAAQSKLNAIEAGADVTDVDNVNSAGAVMEFDYGAQSILQATSDDTPVVLTVPEQTVVGRITSGNITALTPTQIRNLINVTDGANVNVPTTLEAGTVNATTYGITSDGSADDIVLPEADTDNAGLLGADKWDEIVANTAKATNVSTTLSTGTVAATTYGITSDGSADDVVIAAATTSLAGVMTGADKTKLDGIEALADVTDSANVNTAGAVMESDFNATTFLYATSDNTPQPKTVAETLVILDVESGAEVNTVERSDVSDIISAGPGYYFDGVNDKISVSNDTDLIFGTGDFTVISGFKNLALAGSGSIYSKGGVSADPSNTFYMRKGYDDGSILSTIRDAVASSYIRIYLADYGGLGKDTVITQTRDGDDYLVYVNGDFFDSATGVDDFDLTDTNDLQIGYGNAYSNMEFNFLKIFNMTLDADEILALSNGADVPYKYQGASQTAAYESDFSAGVDGWAAQRGVLSGNVDSIGGENDWLRYTIDTQDATHRLYADVPTLTVGKHYRLVFKYYLPSTNSDMTYFSIWDGDGGVKLQDNLNTTDTVTTVIIDFTATSTKFLKIYGIGGGTFQDSGGDDILYIKDIAIKQIGCVQNLNPGGVTPTLWHDASGNDLDGTVSGATEINPPQYGRSSLMASDGSPNPALSVDATGNIGIGCADNNGIGVSAGRKYLALIGDTGRAEISVGSAAADADGAFLGAYHFTDINNSTDNRVASIYGSQEGTTATERGGVIRFYVRPSGTSASSEKMRINSSGNVGIGTTTPTDYKLDVVTTAAGVSGVGIKVPTGGYDFLGLISGWTGYKAWGLNDGSNSNFAINRHLASTGVFQDTPFRILNANGYVGIGGVTPSTPLHVYHATENDIATIESGTTLSVVKIKNSTSTSSIGNYGSLVYINPTSSTYDYRYTQSAFYPSTDSVLDIGLTGTRFADGYFDTLHTSIGTVTSSDPDVKKDITELVDTSKFIDGLKAKAFKYKDEIKPAKTEIITRQKVNIITKEVTETEIVEIDGKMVKQEVTKMVEEKEPVFEEKLLFDADGAPIMKAVDIVPVPLPETDPEDLVWSSDDSLSNSIDATEDSVSVSEVIEILNKKETELVQETTLVPVMETIEEVTEEKVIPSDGKIHFGVMTTDVADMLTAMGYDPINCGMLDYGNGTEENPTGLIYAELTALLWTDYQATKAQVKAQQTEIDDLQAIVAALDNRLKALETVAKPIIAK